MAQIIAASQDQYEYNQIFLNVGADIRVTGTNTGYMMQSQIQGISTNIANVTTITACTGILSSSNAFVVRVIGLNVTSLLGTVTLVGSYFYGQDPKTTLESLNSQYAGALISQTVATNLGLQIGNNVTVDFTTTSASLALTFTIVGYMQALPGASSTTGGPNQVEFYVNYEYSE